MSHAAIAYTPSVSAGSSTFMEAELTIPANLAYAGSRRRSWLAQRLARKESGD